MPISHLLPDWMRMPALPFLIGNELRAVFSDIRRRARDDRWSA
jgi:hypothetical protein